MHGNVCFIGYIELALESRDQWTTTCRTRLISSRFSHLQEQSAQTIYEEMSAVHGEMFPSYDTRLNLQGDPKRLFINSPRARCGGKIGVFVHTNRRMPVDCLPREIKLLGDQSIRYCME